MNYLKLFLFFFYLKKGKKNNNYIKDFDSNSKLGYDYRYPINNTSINIDEIKKNIISKKNLDILTNKNIGINIKLDLINKYNILNNNIYSCKNNKDLYNKFLEENF